MLRISRFALAVGIVGLLSSSALAADQGTASASDSAATSDFLGDLGTPDCGCDPVWTVTGDAVFMGRSIGNSEQIIHPVGGSTTVSDGSDFHFDFSTGTEITIDRQLAGGNSIELRYLGDLNWATPTVNYGAVGNVQIGSIANFGATDLTANDATRLNSAEINWLHPVIDRITFLAGARWLDLHDELQYHITFPAFNALYDWNESNRLYGGQLGAKVALWNLEGPFSIDAVFKAGVFANSVDNNFNLLPSTGGSFPGGATGTATSFLGEIDLMAMYRFTAHLALQGGYQVLWLDRLSLATDEAATATANSTQNGLTTTGDLFAYGATAGVVVTW